MEGCRDRDFFWKSRVGICSSQSLLGRSVLAMHLMPTTSEPRFDSLDELETLALSERHLEYLGRVVRELHPDMPASIGLPHLIRTILDRVEQSGIDLTDASSEEDIALLAAGRLRQRNRCRTPRPLQRTPRANERLSLSSERTSSVSYSSTARRSYRSSLPVKDPFRSGKPPRSGRG